MPLRGSRNVGADNGGVEGLGLQILSCDFEHEHVRQQLFRLDAEFAGEGPDPA